MHGAFGLCLHKCVRVSVCVKRAHVIYVSVKNFPSKELALGCLLMPLSVSVKSTFATCSDSVREIYAHGDIH